MVSFCRSSLPEVFLGKGFVKRCSKFTGELLCQSVLSVNLLCNFIEIALRYGCSPVNLQHIFRTPFPRNTSECLLLYLWFKSIKLLKIIDQFLWKIAFQLLILVKLQSMIIRITSHSKFFEVYFTSKLESIMTIYKIRFYVKLIVIYNL